MGDTSRRGFLKTAGAAGAGAAAVATLPGAIGGEAAGTATAATGAAALAAVGLSSTALGREFIVHVKDAASGEISILHGSDETVHRDPDLVAQVVRAARKGN